MESTEKAVIASKLIHASLSLLPNHVSKYTIKELETLTIIEIDEAKQQILDEATAEFNRRKDELKKRIKTLEREKNGLEDTIKALKEKNVKAQKDLSEQKESSEIDKRSSQLYIKKVESELHHIKALSKLSPQTPEF